MLRESKITFLGQPSVGKTTLIRALDCLVTNPKSYKTTFKPLAKSRIFDPTEGIAVSRIQVPSQKQQWNIWDLGGQEVYQTIHPFFITEKSVYILVCQTHLPVETARIEHWLNTIKFYAPNSAIMIVATHLYVGKKSNSSKDRLRKFQECIKKEYGHITKNLVHIMAVDVPKGRYMRELLDAIVRVVDNQSYINQVIPPSFIGLDKEIKNACAAKQGASFLTWAEITHLAKSVCGIPEKDHPQAVKFLESLGHLMYFPGKEDLKSRLKSPLAEVQEEVADQTLNGFVLIDCSLITSLFLSILTSSTRSGQSTRRNQKEAGVLPLSLLTQEISPLVPQALKLQFVHLLEYFDIAFPLADGTSVFVPSLLPESLPNFQSQWPAFAPKAVQLVRDYTFNFLPCGLFSRLVIRLHQKYDNVQSWKSGILFGYSNSMCLITNKTAKNRITIAVRGVVEKGETPALVFLSIIDLLNALVEHTFQVKPQIGLPCPGCIQARAMEPTSFSMATCQNAIARSKTEVLCDKYADSPHSVTIAEIAPEIALLGISGRVLDIKTVETGVKIGVGGFATVYQAKFEGKDVALKLITEDMTHDPDKQQEINEIYRREVLTMSSLEGENFLAIYGFSLLPPLGMVMELIEYGDLQKYLSTKPKSLTWELRLRIALDIATGISAMHNSTPPLVHRDLKSPNILLKSLDPFCPPCAKITDFGCSMPLITTQLKGQKAAKRDVANPTWLAPEVLKGSPSDTALDIYSFGIILWELLTMSLPFQNYEFDADCEKDILAGRRPPIPSDCPLSYSTLMEACLGQES